MKKTIMILPYLHAFGLSTLLFWLVGSPFFYGLMILPLLYSLARRKGLC